ncbi:MAG: energy transducer TonB [Nitrospinota bacterium]
MNFCNQKSLITFDRYFSKFIGYSFLAHLILLIMMVFTLFLRSSQLPNAEAKVKIIVATSENSFERGKVIDLPEQSKKIDENNASILSRHDNVGKVIGRDNSDAGSKTVAQKKRISPPPTAMKKSSSYEERELPVENKTKIRSPLSDSISESNNISPTYVSSFTKEKMVQPKNYEEIDRAIIANRETDRKNKKISVVKTDQMLDNQTNKQAKDGSNYEGDRLQDSSLKVNNDYIDLGSEAIVSINTKRFEFVDYFEHIKKQIDRSWHYPEDAMVDGLAGDLTLFFTITADGKLESVQIDRSSGVKVLDTEALNAINLAAPFQTFPTNLKKKKLHVLIYFEYSPTYTVIR